MASFSDDFEEEIKRQVTEQFDRTINIPDGLTEDQAVAYVIDAYRKQPGVEVSEDDVRAEVRNEMRGRETT